jgi:hypothetical protein
MHAVTQSCDRPVWNEQLNYVLVLFLAESGGQALHKFAGSKFCCAALCGT